MKIKGIIKKELLDGARSYRFFIVIAAFLFFAIMNPIMTKLVMPELFRSMYPDISEEMINTMLSLNHVDAIRTFLGDAFEMVTIILAFTYSGIIAQEISERKLILPVCLGKRYEEIVIGKLIVHGLILFIASSLSALINYYYSGVLFGFELPSVLPALRAGFLQGLYMIFVLSMLMLIGSIVKRPMVTGLLTLIPAYGLGFVGDLLNINQYLPSGLISEGHLLSLSASTDMLQSIICTLGILAVASILTMIRLINMELARG